ncbi:hypothetical protein [Microbacterium stercoris]|uniref:Uncharacterized protein n=1 Tax=Microbacterium stercoris TaxID=2820289 RepID=A0A939QRC9_9MICO|nr:hypothetical protein [Microbacterium stercoris]MBO3663638.1 hypothetical protein [Microbacterium stercoris]
MEQQITRDVDEAFAEMVAGIESLESLEAAWDWGQFWTAFGIGAGAASAIGTGIGIGVAIT